MLRTARERSNSEESESDSQRRPRPARPREANGAIFEVDGRPIRFHLYTSGYGALTEGQVGALAEKVEAHGGELVQNEEEANIVIVQFMGVELLRRKYWDSRTVWVEEPAFLQICINTGKCKENLSRPVRRGMGGQPVGASRVPFTAEDDRHLCEYLASVVPDQDEGGRGGREIYKRLMESATQFEHRGWARRHTMWSWRERYVKRKAIFDPIIAQIVAENPPRPDGKGLYERSRYFNPRARRLDEAGSGSDEEDEFEKGSEDAMQEQAGGQQENNANAQDERPRRQRQSEPIASKRVDDTMHAPPRKKARHTEVPPRRVSPVEQTRGPQPTWSANRKGKSVQPLTLASEDIPFEEPSADEEDVDFDVLFGGDRPNPVGAGPSGTQHSPPPLAPSRLQNNAKQVPRDAQYQQSSRNAKPGPSQLPMSSQATLVAPSQGRHQPPTSTFGGRTQVAREEEVSSDEEEPIPKAAPSRSRENPTVSRPNAPEVWPQEPQRRRAPIPPPKRLAAAAPNGADQVSKRKRIGVVSMPPVPGLFPNADVARDHPKENEVVAEARNGTAAAGPSSQWQAHPGLSYEAGPSQRSLDRRDGEHSLVSAQTQEGDEEEKHVEEQLALTHGASMTSAASKHPFEEDLDSDDERARQSLLSNYNGSIDASRSFGHNVSATNRLLASQLPVYDADNEGESPESARRTSGVIHPPSAQRSSASRPSSSRPPLVTPVPPAVLNRTTSMGSETDPTMPMPGTRARQEKMRMREQRKQTPYTPPSGTRAAQAVESLQLRSRQVLRQAARR
ncbi:hypothetical protein DAEQUDRAFT_761548 [Daedalea quercina L-15889]|uniref:TERF2-interacting telomeric protein 1 Myb domain-containing protein n=1 Tax=Daedalea quercina L-15889 TaxID=1314783 RepID=A0A165TXH2_9APHY|nr:hypothetical protein DAEQUDRAFT_761548 [Daedalea quercina L-15889]